MKRPPSTPRRSTLLALLGLAAVLAGCTDDPTAPAAPGEEPMEAASPQATKLSLDPMVGVLLGSLEDLRTARAIQAWLDNVLLQGRADAPSAAQDPLPRITIWTAEPTNPNDLVTLDVLRLLLGDVPGAGDSRSQEEIKR